MSVLRTQGQKAVMFFLNIHSNPPFPGSIPEIKGMSRLDLIYMKFQKMQTNLLYQKSDEFLPRDRGIGEEDWRAKTHKET